MSYLEALARQGIRASIQLWLEPRVAITDEIRELVRANKAAIIQEVLAAERSLPADRAEHLFPAEGDWPFALPIAPEAVAKVDVIREAALEFGWTEAALYQNRGRYPFPYGQDYGLVCFLAGNRDVGEMTREHIEIVCRQASGAIYRHYNLSVPQPWIRSGFQNSYTQSTTLSEKRR